MGQQAVDMAGGERRDTLVCAAVALAAFAFFCINIAQPGIPFFDETHYVPAARAMLDLTGPVNTEHPLLGKSIMAGGIRLFGDNSWGWRLPSALFGAIALFGAMLLARELFGGLRPALLAGVLLLADHMLFVQSRIGMLDIFMAAFFMLASWQLAVAIRSERHAWVPLALAGVFLGLSLGAKWTVAPFAVAIGLGFFVWRAVALGRSGFNPGTLLLARMAAPVPGVSLLQAFVLLALLPLAVYMATFIPAFFYATDPIAPGDLFAYQLEIAAKQSAGMGEHPYASLWWQWVLDVRPIWYLYERVDGVLRGVLLLGNPVIMWAGLPALVLSVILGVRHRRLALFVPAFGWLLAVELWIALPKAVTFYHHYFIPSFFLCFALAGTLEYLWLRDRKYLFPVLLVGAALLVFADFYPILAALPLADDQAFNHWMWLDSWR